VIYAVTLVEDYPLDFRTLQGIGTLWRGTTVELDLTPEQVQSLRGRGIDVHQPQSRKTKKIKDTIEAVAEPAAQED
jgi:hypothetical protein